jgi:hypothetical protein
MIGAQVPAALHRAYLCKRPCGSCSKRSIEDHYLRLPNASSSIGHSRTWHAHLNRW